MTYRVRLMPEAKAALREAAHFIAERDGLGRAESWLDRTLQSIDRLESMPKAFAIWSERRGRPLYSKLIRPYRVFYVVDDQSKCVFILDLVHTARETRLARYRRT